MASLETEVYDLLLLVDATASMGTYLESLQSSLPQIISVSALTDCFSRIGLLAYRDYTEQDDPVNGLLDWSGWLDLTGSGPGITAEELMAKARNLDADGGGDHPEATKTGLAKAYQVMREDATTIILLYTDAPPQTTMTGHRFPASNYLKEQDALKDTGDYGPTGHLFADWVSACNTLRSGNKHAQVFCFLEEALGESKAYSGYYSYLSAISKGCCLYLHESQSTTIAETTVDVLLAWMGVDKEHGESSAAKATLVRYKDGKQIKSIKDEKDPAAKKFFWAGKVDWSSLHQRPDSNAEACIEQNIAIVDATQLALQQYLPKIKTPIIDFSERYTKDDSYKTLAVGQLQKLIETDVSAISLNPVFGKLWRAVCNDRQNPARDDLVQAFGFAVDKISDEAEKLRMRAWLDSSFDFTTDIVETIEEVPQSDKFPCVFLDPTLEFSTSMQPNSDAPGEDSDSNSAFRRDELLEIARSCDPRVLRRLGKVLTRLTYVKSAEELPAHIAATNDREVPKIPVALASQEYQWKFWKVLLHLVVPGTMLASRPAVLLAALSLRMGVEPLLGPAASAMLFWRDKWNDISITENWNTSCLSLLIDADNAYRGRRKSEQTGNVADGLLKYEDRKLFDTLVSYKLAEANLQTTLTARVGWTPNKTSMPIGPQVVCKSCQYLRSITMMSEQKFGKCGLCASEYASEKLRKAYIDAHVSSDDNESTAASWVECSVRTCRAQYVVYNIERLNVRSKCFNCRDLSADSGTEKNSSTPHWLECTKCLNRVIWPKPYRTGRMDGFTCVACSSGRQAIVDTETSAQQLSKENGQQWLLLNKDKTLSEPFNGRSLYHTIKNAGTASIAENVVVLPDDGKQQSLTVHGKLVRNIEDVKSQLRAWISRRAVEAVPCSLCFTDVHKSKLHPACGRKGCDQQICHSCLDNWYGLNAAGHVINTAALFCAFCRRPPSAKTLAAYGTGIHAVRSLQTAVKERGEWIYAWCTSCGTACRFVERSCARGAPPAVNDFTCEPCIEFEMTEIRKAEEEAATARWFAATIESEDRNAARDRARRAAHLRKRIEVKPKPCPGCGTLSVRTSGCNHLICAVPKCGVDWCWFCGKAFPDDDIYDHMNKEHGGMFAGQPGLDSDGDWD